MSATQELPRSNILSDKQPKFTEGSAFAALRRIHLTYVQNRPGVKVLLGILIALLLMLQYKFWFGDSGFRQIRAYEHRIGVLEQELKQMEEKNAALQAEVNDLKNGMAAVEERARRDLGMIRKNETFFQIIESAKE